MIPPKAVFFDLDETLLDGSGFQDSLVRTCQAISAVQQSLNADLILAANREVWTGYWPQVEDKWMLGSLDGASVSGEAWRRTLEACGCVDESIVRLAYETHSRYAKEAHRMFDDARAVIDLVRARLPIALITNGARDTQRQKVGVLGIEAHFAAVLISGEAGLAKPDPAIFRLALDKLGLGPEGVWHVGDSLTSDVAGANAAGLTAVWLNRAGRERAATDPQPDIEIRSLAELLPLIEETL